MINLLPWAFLLALTAFVYCHVLTDAGMILSAWKVWLDELLGPGSSKQIPFEVPDPIDPENAPPRKGYTVTKPRAKWLFKLLVGCCKCVTGQFACWGYFYVISKEVLQPYNLIHHVVFISFAIYTVKFIAQAYEWKTNN